MLSSGCTYRSPFTCAHLRRSDFFDPWYQTGDKTSYWRFSASRISTRATHFGNSAIYTTPVKIRSGYSKRYRAPPKLVFQAPVSSSRNFIACRSNTPISFFNFQARQSTRFICQSSTSSWYLVAIFSVVILLSTFGNLPSSTCDGSVRPTHHQKITAKERKDEICEMDAENTTGHVWNLTPEQEEKLKELWIATFQVFQVIDESAPTAPGDAKNKPDPGSAKKPKKKRISIFKRGKDEEQVVGEDEVDDKFGQRKVFNEALANMTPESLRSTLWSMIKADDPDALLLRFLRARQWNVEKALIMMISTMRWRLIEAHIDDDVMLNGELYALNESSDSDATKQKFGKDFLENFRKGKSYVHGTDKKDRPLVYVRVRQHKTGELSEESLERFTLYLIETTRMILHPPIETASVIFDMTGFSMANMDYAPVKFMIKVFEANYPECLGVVLVHRAPWIFQGIWKIIRGWLDPVVASKIHFTNNIEEMEAYVDKSHITADLGGDDKWTYEYIEPVPGENDAMKDTESRDKLLQERQKLVKDFENTTLEWIHASSADSSSINEKRQQTAKSMTENYWRLDPFIRARSFYDRTGVINPGGIINLK